MLPALALPWRSNGDIVLMVVVVVGTFIVSARFNVAEMLRRVTRPYEHLQLDELPTVALAAALGLVWFAWRRYRETRFELARRQAAEACLAATLDEKNHLARRFIDAQEAERRNLARELHDELGQYLNAIKLDAVSIVRHADQAPVHTRARSIVDSVDRVHVVVQTMIRRFRPVALDELGLLAALEHSIQDWRRRMPDTRLRLTATGDLDDCGEAINLAVYRMVQEGLTNVSRHARARRVEVRLERLTRADGGSRIHLRIDDDGVGTDLNFPRSGLGLLGMRERAELLGGDFCLASRPGRGFSLHAALPVAVGHPL